MEPRCKAEERFTGGKIFTRLPRPIFVMYISTNFRSHYPYFMYAITRAINLPYETDLHLLSEELWVHGSHYDNKIVSHIPLDILHLGHRAVGWAGDTRNPKTLNILEIFRRCNYLRVAVFDSVFEPIPSCTRGLAWNLRVLGHIIVSLCPTVCRYTAPLFVAKTVRLVPPRRKQFAERRRCSSKYSCELLAWELRDVSSRIEFHSYHLDKVEVSGRVLGLTFTFSRRDGGIEGLHMIMKKHV